VDLYPCSVHAHFPSCLIVVFLPEYGGSGAPDFSLWRMCCQLLIQGVGKDESKR
jgi:hypothetical protein